MSAVDFAARFETNINQLAELLGITRRIEKKPGQVVKTYKVTGKLEDGNVAEGEVIPCQAQDRGRRDLRAQAQEVAQADLLRGHQRQGLRAGGRGHRREDAARRQEASARTSSTSCPPARARHPARPAGRARRLLDQNQVLWEDTDASGYLYFVNPEDIGEYLAKKDATVQTAFGMTYLEAFLGIYDVLVYTGVPKGKVITTAKDNIILYYTNPKNGDVAKAFEFVTDATGLIGVHRTVDYDDLTTNDRAHRLKLFAEVMDGIVVCAIEAPSATPAPNPAG
ncbi:MAG: hypothetical protein ACLSVD_02855 [Eggerthellaceae bacterium]